MKQIIFYVMLIFLMMENTFILQAQTGGPGQAEYTSFEPFGKSGPNVAPQTGDMTYSIPVFHIPGPGGGYSMSLFNHAGIKADQVASWVGLGWNMNPGAITRSIIGHPDDADGKELLELSTVELNPTEFEHLKIGVGYEYIQASFGFDRVNSTTSYSGAISGLGISDGKLKSTSHSSNPYVSSYMTSGFKPFGISIPIPLPNGMLSASFSYGHWWNRNFYNRVLGKQRYGILYTANGYHDYDDNSGGYLLHSYSTAPPPATNYNILNAQSIGTETNTYSLDSYKIPFKKDQEDERHCNLSFPAYDKFQVNAEGLSGIFSASFNENISVPRESMALDWWTEGGSGNNCFPFMSPLPTIECHSCELNYEKEQLYFLNQQKASTNKLQFSFESGGLAKIIVPDGTWNNTTNINSNTTQNPLNEVSYSGQTAPSMTTFFNPSTNKKGSANDIEWFTNEEILDPNSGAKYKLKVSENLGLNRTIDTKGIGGFVITNTEGYTYHFSLPVYQYEEMNITGILPNPTQTHFSSYKKDPYAIHWLLTGITGPDYIDSDDNNFGIIDDADLGYWVKFNYGKWSDGYIWRSPFLDNVQEGNTISKAIGRKELYYLNSVETTTHIAYFIKSIRKDGYSSLDEEGIESEWRPKDNTLFHFSLQNDVPYRWLPTELVGKDKITISLLHKFFYNLEEESNRVYPLRLDSIIVLPKKELAQNLSYNIDNNFPSSPIASFNHEIFILNGQSITNEDNCSFLPGDVFNLTITANQPIFIDPRINFSTYNPHNTLTNHDISSPLANMLHDKSLSVIKFDYSIKDVNGNITEEYRLAKNSPNSDATTKGRLTLERLITHGLKNEKVSPSYIFNYINEDVEYNKDKIDSWGYQIDCGNLPGGKMYAYSDACNKCPQNWSLSSITNPLGGKQEIEYESDTYSREAVFGKNEWVIHPTLSYNNINNTIFANFTKEEASSINCFMSQYMPVSIEIAEDGVLNSQFNQPILLNSSYPITTPITGQQYPIVQLGNGNGYVLEAAATVTLSNFIGYGGGIRVKSIVSKENQTNSDNYAIKYNYNSPITEKTSGVTSYVPGKKEFIPYESEIPSPFVSYEYVTIKAFGTDNRSSDYRQYHFEVLPNALYDSQTLNFSMGDIFRVTNTNDFESYNQNIINDRQDGVFMRKGIIHNKISALGRVLTLKEYNIDNVLLSQEKYFYQDNQSINTEGVNQETYNEIKVDKINVAVDQDFCAPFCKDVSLDDKPFYNWYFTTSSRITYPNLLKSVTTEAGGLKSEVAYSDYDVYTGIPKTTTTTNGYGEEIKSTTEFAHTNNNYAKLGSKAMNSSHTNMLTAPLKATTTNGGQIMSVGVATYTNSWTYRERDANGHYQTVSVNPNQNAIGQWRSDASYSWKGLVEKNGSLGNVANFPFNSPPQISSNPNQGWERVSEPTLYDHSSHVLEARGMNNRFVSTKYGYGKYMRTLASVANARYTEFVYSGAEDVLDGSWAEFGGEVGAGVPATNIYTAASPIDAYTHTGYHSIRLETNQWGLGYSGTIGDISNINNVTDVFQEGKTYRASVWVRAENGVQLNSWFKLNATVTNSSNQVLHTYTTDVTTTTTFKAGDWYLLNLDIPLSQYPNAYKVSIGTCNLNASMPVYVDDFRVHPLDAPLKSYVYDKVGRVIAVLDNDNIASRFTYDAASNVIKSEQETKDGFRVISQEQMHFARPLE